MGVSWSFGIAAAFRRELPIDNFVLAWGVPNLKNNISHNNGT
jgi:hypothetical protein